MKKQYTMKNKYRAIFICIDGLFLFNNVSFVELILIYFFSYIIFYYDTSTLKRRFSLQFQNDMRHKLYTLTPKIEMFLSIQKHIRSTCDLFLHINMPFSFLCTWSGRNTYNMCTKRFMNQTLGNKWGITKAQNCFQLTTRKQNTNEMISVFFPCFEILEILLFLVQ